jgi:hypothetical protein
MMRTWILCGAGGAWPHNANVEIRISTGMRDFIGYCGQHVMPVLRESKETLDTGKLCAIESYRTMTEKAGRMAPEMKFS